jgi:hypothetical protein
MSAMPSSLSAVFGWPAVSIVSALVLTIGFGVMSMNPPAFLMAKICFTVTAVIFMARVGFWLASTTMPIAERLVLTALICGVGGVCWVELIHWVDIRQPKPGGTVKVVFSNSPLLTEHRKTFIAAEIEGIRNYLIDLGFTVPVNIPPIQASKQGFMIGSPSEYGYSITLPDSALDDRLAVRSSYTLFVFYQVLRVPQTSLVEEANRWEAARQFSTYFVSSYSDTDYSTHKEWDVVMWRLRNEVGRDFMDHAMFYAVKLFDNTPGDPKGDFDKYFRDHMERGLLVMENPGSTWRPQLDRIINEISKAKPSPASEEAPK